LTQRPHWGKFLETEKGGASVLTFRKILVPVDDSEHSKRAFRYALGLASTQGAHVALLHCYEHIPMLIAGKAREEVEQEHIRSAEKLLGPYVKRLRDIGVEPALHIKEGAPGDVIVREAASGDYDLVVMGSRGLSDLEGVLLGSTAHHVLAEAGCPVLLVR
jgi:nucleotide-binding universal stress UspA family protein